MFLQQFIITLAMSCIVSSPIITPSTTTTSNSTTTSSSTTTETFMVSSSTTDTIISLSSTTTSTSLVTTIKTITTLSKTTELSSSSPTSTITKTTAISVTTTTALTTSNRHSPYNRSCFFRGKVFNQHGKHPGWLCDDQTTCIPLIAVCDGVTQPGCPDGSDEAAGCSENPYCNKGGRPGWRCDSGDCINRFSVCDSDYDCRDRSDERTGCKELDLVPCPVENNTLTERWAANVDCRRCLHPYNWRCDNGHCVLKYWVCDERPQCSGSSDEWKGCKSDYKDRFPPNNNNRSCLTKFGDPGWLCDDQTTCIWLGHVCDGIPPPDCPDDSDEAAGCTEDPRYCRYETGLPGWRCGSGECIYKFKVCDGQPECRDGSDEIAGCAAMDLVPCPTDNNTLTERWAANVDCRLCWDHVNNWRCDNGRCTRKGRVCNGDPGGCDDGSDEWEGCELVTCGNDSSITTAAMFAGGDCRRCWDEQYWRCNDGSCIGKAKLCDGVEDCQSGEDETVVCSSLVPCLDKRVTVMTEQNYNQPGQCRSCFRADQWRCNSGQCIHKDDVCNNVMFGRWDCKDGSDEDPGSGCPANVTCVADKSIITTPHFFNGTITKCLSCAGNSLDSEVKSANNYKRCKNGQCKHKVHFCNGYNDCADGSDEIGCNIFAYFNTKRAILLSFGLVALTAYLYIKFTNFHITNLISAPQKYPKKIPSLYKNIKNYCDILELDTDNNANRLKKLHNSIRKKRNGLKQLIVATCSLYEEPQLCHKYCNIILNNETHFHRNTNESLMYIRMTAGSNFYTEKFANSIEPPGFFAKLSFSSSNQLEYVSLKTGHCMRLIKALSKMVLFYLDVIKDIALFFKLWHIVSELEETNILHHVLVYISCIVIFLAQSIIGIYMTMQLGKPHKKLPSSLFPLVLFLLFLISPLIPIVLVVKDSLLNSDIEEKKHEMKKNKRQGLTKFLTFISLTNEEATQTKQQFSFHKIINSLLESLPQVIIYAIFCLTYYYDNSLVPILFNNTNTSNTILFACSIPLSLYSVVSGVSAYSSMDGKSHYTKQISYLLQLVSRVCAILSFISPLYALYFTHFKTSFESLFGSYQNYSWIRDFLTTSLISISYPHVAHLFILLSMIFALHVAFIYFYSDKNTPGFSDAPLFHKLTHTIANIFVVLPWRPLGQEDQRRRSREHQNFHLAMAVSNIIIVILSSIFREYTQVDYILQGYGTRQHLEWIHYLVNLFSPSTLPLLEQVSPYHYPIGVLLNVLAHIPRIILVLFFQCLGIITMSIYYKKFHPWRTIINTKDVNKTITAQEFFATRIEDLEEDSEVDWVSEDEMEEEEDEDEVDVIAEVIENEDQIESGDDHVHENVDGEQFELRVIVENNSRQKLQQERLVLEESLNMHRKKRENSRREFFSEITSVKGSEKKASNGSYFTKNNEYKIQVDVHQAEDKTELESSDREALSELEDVLEDALRGDCQDEATPTLPHLNDKALADVSIIVEDKEPMETEKVSNEVLCREIILDLVEKTLMREYIPHIENFKEENLCKEIVLELVCDAVARVPR